MLSVSHRLKIPPHQSRNILPPLQVWVNVSTTICPICLYPFQITKNSKTFLTLEQGFLIAYTSESLTQLLYAMQNGGSTVGYMNHSLSHAPIESTSHSCRYEDFRTVKGIRSKFYYELAVFRLAFVLLYVVSPLSRTCLPPNASADVVCSVHAVRASPTPSVR
ncbi:hypothetical protein RvY_18998-1 [Ramazzottius varieornatus]|uniref:Uncharacterized protein n=1 Tax=Ramazzottius varieornatus TaxID=947166 RepID=A0A1D1W7T8_RAMVA|nr:hypothetical protein RvY_18998-1 [Ramazzottius varieornatus]